LLRGKSSMAVGQQKSRSRKIGALACEVAQYFVIFQF
jgi:hypothetical protein